MSQALESEYVFVDLDGTLIHTDLTWMGVQKFVDGKPWRWLTLGFWFLLGRGYLKPKLAEQVDLDPIPLPYCPVVRSYLGVQREANKKIILATASPHKWTDQIVENLGDFDGVIATGNGVNLRGKAKLKEMKRIAGDKKFAYIGNSWVDYVVFKGCHEAVLIHGPLALVRKLAAKHPRPVFLSCEE